MHLVTHNFSYFSACFSDLAVVQLSQYARLNFTWPYSACLTMHYLGFCSILLHLLFLEMCPPKNLILGCLTWGLLQRLAFFLWNPQTCIKHWSFLWVLWMHLDTEVWIQLQPHIPACFLSMKSKLWWQQKQSSKVSFSEQDHCVPTTDLPLPRQTNLFHKLPVQQLYCGGTYIIRIIPSDCTILPLVKMSLNSLQQYQHRWKLTKCIGMYSGYFTKLIFYCLCLFF